MFPLQSQPQRQTGDNQKSRSLVMTMTEVAPLLDISPFSSSSSSTTTRSIFSDGHNEPAPPNRLPIVQHKLGWTPTKTFSLLASILRSLFPSLQSLLTPVCHWLNVNVSPVMNPTSASPCRRRITGTFFGQKRGRVCFAVQEDPRSEPALLLDLAIPTCHLVKEMASGVLRILLECERSAAPAATGTKKMKKHPPHRSLWEEPRWTMYCNGHKRGYAVSRPCTESDFQVLSAVQAVSVGAGVLPVASFPPALQPPHRLEKKEKLNNDGAGGAGSEVMYMRAKFERVLGGKDSEALYMINPDSGRGSNGGPELSIFLLRI